MNANRFHAQPADKKLLTRGVYLLLALMATAVVVAIYRFIFGIGSITNLSNQYPWGIWIGIDVATGIALAAGGFTTAALVYVFQRKNFMAVVRPALLTALLGYTCEVVGLLADLGRYYNVWHPLWPTMWSGHSVMFTVGLCVTFYLVVLYLEFAPIVCERFINAGNNFLGDFGDIFRFCDGMLRKIMPFLILAGVVISCIHQQAIGGLMLVAPYKLHPLWYTPLLPLMFLISAIAVGFPMVTFESMLASRTFKRRIEMEVLEPLNRFVVVLLGIYIAVRFGDLSFSGNLRYAFDGSLEAKSFWVEIIGGAIVPWIMLLSCRLRRSPIALFAASTLIVLGVALNRVNVFLIGYHPPYAEKPYFPAVTEILITLGLIAGLLFVYRVAATYLPILPAEEHGETDAVAVNSSR